VRAHRASGHDDGSDAVSMEALELRIVFRCTCEGWQTDHTEFEDLNEALVHLQHTDGDARKPNVWTEPRRPSPPPTCRSGIGCARKRRTDIRRSTRS